MEQKAEPRDKAMKLQPTSSCKGAKNTQEKGLLSGSGHGAGECGSLLAERLNEPLALYKSQLNG